MIGRMGKRYQPSALWSLVFLPPLEASQADLKELRRMAKKLQKHLQDHHNGVVHFEVRAEEAAGRQGPVLVVSKTLHGTTIKSELDASFFASNEYQSMCILGERLRSLGRGPLTAKRGENVHSASDFKAALDWYMQQARRGLNLQRYKGLGEMNPEQLWDTTMDPAKRRLLKVVVEDDVASDDTFTVLMGDQVEPRRDFIEKNAFSVSNLDV